MDSLGSVITVCADRVRWLWTLASRTIKCRHLRRFHFHVEGSAARGSSVCTGLILHAQKGGHDNAIALYKRVESSSATLRLAARNNRGNRYLMQAMELDDQAPKQLGLPLVEMAKDTYRAVLRAEPSAWDAKYNLERALRLVPDPDDSDDEDLPPPQQSERALTTMRGFTLGLP